MGQKKLPAVWETAKEKDPQHLLRLSPHNVIRGSRGRRTKKTPPINVPSPQQHLKMKTFVAWKHETASSLLLNLEILGGSLTSRDHYAVFL